VRLEHLAREIERFTREADDKVVDAALAIRDLGEWAAEHVNLAESRLGELTGIANAEDLRQ
jgi:hypothetical protein